MTKRRIVSALILTVLAAAALLLPAASATEPLLVNGGFEGGWHRANVFWTPVGGPYDYYEFGEIAPPERWTAWWREGFPCAGTDEWLTGRPEVRVITAVPDSGRVRSGEQAVQWFTFWRCHHGGLFQQVEVEAGRYYDFSIFAHSWFSNCSTKPHDPPLDYDCETPIEWAQSWLRVGIDPTGGTDPRASTVVWGPEREVYGGYSDIPLVTGRVQAQTDKITVIVESVASHPLKHCDFYIDDAVLIDCTHRIFLPVAIRG